MAPTEERPNPKPVVGEATRLAIGVAGLDRRRTKNRLAAILALALAAVIGCLAILDATRVITLPVMGAVYDAAGIADPNAQREVRRVEAELLESDLTEAQRQALADRLVAAQQRLAVEESAAAPGVTAPPSARPTTPSPAPLAPEERALATDVFGDARKQEARVALPTTEQTPSPTLPDGLSQEAIAKVLADNSSSMSLCIAEAARKGEVLSGRMEVAITVGPDGAVEAATIESRRFAGSIVGACATRRIRAWKFPAFGGEPVTVIFPYVLESAL
jgi:hypothetical protein